MGKKIENKHGTIKNKLNNIEMISLNYIGMKNPNQTQKNCQLKIAGNKRKKWENLFENAKYNQENYSMEY